MKGAVHLSWARLVRFQSLASVTLLFAGLRTALPFNPRCTTLASPRHEPHATCACTGECSSVVLRTGSLPRAEAKGAEDQAHQQWAGCGGDAAQRLRRSHPARGARPSGREPRASLQQAWRLQKRLRQCGAGCLTGCPFPWDVLVRACLPGMLMACTCDRQPPSTLQQPKLD